MYTVVSDLLQQFKLSKLKLIFYKRLLKQYNILIYNNTKLILSQVTRRWRILHGRLTRAPIKVYGSSAFVAETDITIYPRRQMHKHPEGGDKNGKFPSPLSY